MGRGKEESETTFSGFTDPRLVAVCDTINPIDEHETFYPDLAKELSAASIGEPRFRARTELEQDLSDAASPETIFAVRGWASAGSGRIS